MLKIDEYKKRNLEARIKHQSFSITLCWLWEQFNDMSQPFVYANDLCSVLGVSNRRAKQILDDLIMYGILFKVRKGIIAEYRLKNKKLLEEFFIKAKEELKKAGLWIEK
jgi:hypothetical protein